MFSFVYDRKHSSELLGHWTHDRWETEDGFCEQWRDPETGLQVRAHITNHSEEATEWFVEFTNTGTRPTPILEQVNAAWVTIPGQRGWRETAYLHTLSGGKNSPDDWTMETKELRPATWHRFGPSDGKSSSGAFPFFNLQWDGGGVITAIGWTGQWQASVAWGTVTEIYAGQERLHLSLLVGESIRTPSILQMWWEGNIEDSYNRFRKLMLEHIMPPIVPPISCMTTTCYDLNDSSEQGVLAHLDACDGLGFEVLWMDAYWHDGGFPVGVGNKTDFERYPNGLGYIGENAHEAGMEFLLWHDIERVSLGTEMDRLHPDWLLSADGRDCKLFNLGNPDALDYITQFMIREVDEKNIDWLRMDPCIDYLPYWRHADPPGRVGMTEMRYVEGLYKLVDTLLDAHPHLNIDNCGGGARRVDLEMCKRATVLWRIDLTTIIRERERDYGLAAMLDQAMITGLSHYLPYHCCGVYRERPYWFRSCLNAGVVFLDDLRYEFYPRDTLRAAIEEAKRVRKYFAGNIYVLTPITRNPADWHAVQYHLPGEGAGMILAFRRHECESDEFVLDLREIDPGATYAVCTSHSYTPHCVSARGYELQRMKIKVNEKPGSVLIEYKEELPC